MDIRIFQMNVIAGDPEANFASIKQFVDGNMDADLLVLPEMCIGGYLVGDEWNREDFARWIESYNDEIKNLSKPIETCDKKPVSIVWGNIAIDETKVNEDGRIRKYNAVWAAHNGEYIKRSLYGRDLPPYQAKTLMPNYRFFDDKRYFTSFEKYIKEKFPDLDERDLDGEESVFVPYNIYCYSDKKNYRVGLEVCEDMWYSDYNINPTKGYANNGADFIVNVSASPWTWGKEKARANVVKKLSNELKEIELDMPPIYYANIVGAQNNGKNIITFDGRSTVYNSDGNISKEDCNLFKQSVMKTEFPVPVKDNIPKINSHSDSDSIKYDEKIKAISTGLKHIALKGSQQWVIGLSGGIDSCVSAAILAFTFGPENVHGINMPSQYNSKETKNAAYNLAKNLHIKYTVIPIDSAIKAKRKNIAKAVDNYLNTLKTNSIHEENEQARMRGSILMDIAAAKGAFFVNNGNKVETAAGYASMYGDIAGAVAPLADLTKEEVYGMARYINNHFKGWEELEIIPQEVILNEQFETEGKIKPSAELRHDQSDPLLFGFMCRLIEKGIMDYKKVGIETVLKSWLNRTIIEDFDLDQELFYKYELHKAEVFVDEIEFIFKQLKRSTFKRVQTPPIIITSKSSFGYDYRESILPYKISKEAKILMNKIKDKKFY